MTTIYALVTRIPYRTDNLPEGHPVSDNATESVRMPRISGSVHTVAPTEICRFPIVYT